MTLYFKWYWWQLTLIRARWNKITHYRSECWSNKTQILPCPLPQDNLLLILKVFPIRENVRKISKLHWDNLKNFEKSFLHWSKLLFLEKALPAKAAFREDLLMASFSELTPLVVFVDTLRSSSSNGLLKREENCDHHVWKYLIHYTKVIGKGDKYKSNTERFFYIRT